MVFKLFTVIQTILFRRYGLNFFNKKISICNMLTLTGREWLLLILFHSVVTISVPFLFQLLGPMGNPEKTPGNRQILKRCGNRNQLINVTRI